MLHSKSLALELKIGAYFASSRCPPNATLALDRETLRECQLANTMIDFGTIRNTSPTTRFEIEGADAAVHFLLLHPEVPDKESNEVWLAIALHTTPQIPERMGGIASLVRQAVMIDFRSEVILERRDCFRAWADHFDALVPRGPIEQELGDAVCGPALKSPKKAPKSSWAADLVRWKKDNPDAVGVNGAF